MQRPPRRRRACPPWPTFLRARPAASFLLAEALRRAEQTVSQALERGVLDARRAQICIRTAEAALERVEHTPHCALRRREEEHPTPRLGLVGRRRNPGVVPRSEVQLRMRV